MSLPGGIYKYMAISESKNAFENSKIEELKKLARKLTYDVICRRCGELTNNRSHYCDECYKIKMCHWDRYQEKQGTQKERGYSTAWRKLRKLVLSRDNYLCQECLKHGKVTPASEVDHILPKSEGGTDDKENLQSLCHDCHRIKTAEESKRGVKRHITRDVFK